ncbi:MAG: metal-dependent hydrolase [Steroidobacteraceae bacterium]
MDNLTHTLIGLVAGEAVARCAPAPARGLAPPVRRTALLLTGMIGGNLPDADLLWSMPIFTGDRLTYLVQHRGYTHTLLGCVLLAVLLFAGTLLLLRSRRHRLRAPDVVLFGAMALLSVMLHLGMDAMNEYGVHPFWPWNNRWYYGDAVFIVEPLCWLAATPLFFALQRRPARIFLGLVLGLGCVTVAALHGSVLTWLGLPLVTALLLWISRRVTPRTASLLSVVLLCAVMGAFAAAHAVVVRRVETLAARQFPGASTLDLVLSPAPATPLCWDVMLLQQEGEDYVARIGQLHLASESGRRCSRLPENAGTAPLRVMNRPVSSGMHWTGEYTMDRRSLAALATGSCDAQRLASFLRAPFAAKSPRGWILGDLRYDRENGPGFAELLIDGRDPAHCAKPSPWVPPRRDLGFQGP